MAPTLEDCPPELIENICLVLDICSICQIRLTCRELASKATQERFKSFLRSKEVLLTRESLRRFVRATESRLVASLLRELRVTGVVSNTILLAATVLKNSGSKNEGPLAHAQYHLDILRKRQQDYEDMHKSRTDVRLLAEAFRNLNVVTNAAPLSIVLGVVIYRTDSQQRLEPSYHRAWKMTWECTANTYQTFMQAASASELRLATLNCFEGERCSIACNELAIPVLQKCRLAFLSTLTSLKLSLSDRVIIESQWEADRSGDPADEVRWEVDEDDRGARDRDVIQQEADDETNFMGLAHLLSHCCNLQELDLHQYHLMLQWPVSLHRERVLQRIVETAPLLSLHSLALRGVHIRGEDLLSLVKGKSMRRLTLQHAFFVAGELRKVCDHCTSQGSGYEYLDFKDLYEGGVRVRYGDSNPTMLGPTTLCRFNSECHQTIIYHTLIESQPSSPAQYDYRVATRKAYGPP